MRHGIHTTTGLAWHCDMGAEILALHVRSLAEAGGHTFVASSWTIYRELATSYPEVLRALLDPRWPIQVLVTTPFLAFDFVIPLLLTFPLGAGLISTLGSGRAIHPDTSLRRCCTSPKTRS